MSKNGEELNSIYLDMIYRAILKHKEKIKFNKYRSHFNYYNILFVDSKVYPQVSIDLTPNGLMTGSKQFI